MRLTTLAAIGIVVPLVATPASASLSQHTGRDELRCMAGTSKNLAKLGFTMEKCVRKCQALVRKGIGTAADCAPPYAGTTLACIADPVKGAKAKALVAIARACPGACPNCYEFASATCDDEAALRVEAVAQAFGGQATLAWCDDSGSGDGLSNVEAKCQDTVGKAVSLFVKKAWQCEDKCVSKAALGVVDPPVACKAPFSDPATAACVDAARTKSLLTIQKACGDAPECHAFDAFLWVSAAQDLIGEHTAYCGLCESDAGAHCWFLGAAGADCADTCAAARLTYDPMTAQYAGSDSENSFAACAGVFADMLAPGSGPTSSVDCGGSGLGCSYDTAGGTRQHCGTPATNATDSAAGVQRVCACR